MLHILEQGASRNGSVHVVKEFVRAGAGHVLPDPQDLRPPDVLLDALHYLIACVLTRTDYPWHVIYEFVVDRIKAIRQDITFQELSGPETVDIYQHASRFYLYSQYRLWDCPLNKFDPKLNLDNLQQCLVKVVRMNLSSVELMAEFEAYYILTNLGNPEVLHHALSLEMDVKSHRLVHIAMAISLCFSSNNFVKCCRLISQLPPLHKAAVMPHLYQVRKRALQTMSMAYSSKHGAFPLKTLCSWILIEDFKEGIEFCTAHGECKHKVMYKL